MPAETSLLQVTKEEGVVDLPPTVKIKFAKALIAERTGMDAEAYALLLQGIEAENALSVE